MSPREKANTERINVFFSSNALQTLKELAAEKGTTTSGIVRMIVLEYMRGMK